MLPNHEDHLKMGTIYKNNTNVERDIFFFYSLGLHKRCSNFHETILTLSRTPFGKHRYIVLPFTL